MIWQQTGIKLLSCLLVHTQIDPAARKAYHQGAFYLTVLQY